MDYVSISISLLKEKVAAALFKKGGQQSEMRARQVIESGCVSMPKKVVGKLEACLEASLQQTCSG